MKKDRLKILLLSLLMAASVPAARAEAAMLHVGDNGAEVRLLQEQLQKLGYNLGSVDGDFGMQTKKAVEALQRDKGLKADGIVDNATWQVLRSEEAVSRELGINTIVNRVLLTAKQFLGVPYVWGGSTPRGFDCSGFTQYVFNLNGIHLPRTADLQFEVGLPVRYNQLQPGDVVYFSTYEPGPSHDGIYIGQGKFINATSSRGIAIDRLNSSYWGPRYIGARRVLR